MQMKRTKGYAVTYFISLNNLPSWERESFSSPRCNIFRKLFCDLSDLSFMRNTQKFSEPLPVPINTNTAWDFTPWTRESLQVACHHEEIPQDELSSMYLLKILEVKFLEKMLQADKWGWEMFCNGI